jgi:lipoprotein-anchoring transpeptidase ErfK/SrfK
MALFRVTLVGLSLAALGACSNTAPSRPAAKAKVAAAAAPTPPSPGAATIQAVGATAYDPAVNAPPVAHAPASSALIKAEVLLDRAHFSPGVIDGQFGQNVHNAITAYEAAHQMTPDGQLTPAVWQALTADRQAVLQSYAIAPQDVQGPFLTTVPASFQAQAKVSTMAFTGPVQLLAEKFHMSEDLMKSLNPGIDFTRAGTPIVVAAPSGAGLPERVARIEVDKAAEAVRAYDANGQLIADFPATVGSEERPSPSGDYKVRGVKWNPQYHYDPRRLTFGHIHHKLTIQPGPNNPVGVVWIALNKPTYGIHGAPDPQKIGKTASHGCVRLTNWDAAELAGAVKPGVAVAFVNAVGSSG